MASDLGESITTSAISDQNSAGAKKQRLTIALVAIIGVILIAALITGLVFLLSPGLTSSETVARIRDIFIILMALESLLIGLALFILMIQIARLTNLLENEVKPILDSTNETISNLRGTTKFLSDNLVEPVIKLNELIAVFQRVTEIFRFTRKDK